MERIVNINIDGNDFIYPLSTIEKQKVIHDNPNGTPIVIFFQDGVVSAMDQSDIKSSRDVGAVTVFSPILNGEVLEFENRKGRIRDKRTSSVWSITGKCLEGEFSGQSLKAILHGNHFAFAWLAAKPKSLIYEQ